MASMSPRSREELLRILLDTATDIAALDDVEDVLQAIVRRTRSLLGTDMAYISFTDLENAETYIRQSDGVTTHGYRTLRQPLHTGVLGEIATGVAPAQTSDYLADDALSHVPRIDEIVRAEGVRAIMGVPLTVGGRALGALVVAERHTRTFTPDEVSDVDSLGRHAAVALDKSMRFAELSRTADDLAQEKDRGAAQLDLISRMVSLDGELIDAVIHAPDVARILDIGARALSSDLELRGRDGTVIATTARTPIPAGDEVGVSARGEVLGALVASQLREPAERSLLERVAAHVALALVVRRAQDEADLRLQTEVLGDLLDRPDAPREHLERWLRRWGIAPGAPLRVVVLDPGTGDRDERVRVLRALGGVVMAAHDDHLCFATPDSDWIARAEQLFRSHGWELRAGVAGPIDDVGGLADAHARAQLAYGSLSALSRAGVVDAADLGMLSALLDLAGRGGIPGSMTAQIDPLLDYDEGHGTALARTAFLYLESDGSVERVALALRVHRNTVRQRLERIGRVLGAGWDASPRRLEIHLALHLARVTSGDSAPVSTRR
ncbi:helix-turn-helix domain-containing protein [Microbacterium halophytorum]|uniref:helix-turn-helix domain-containing protein n=1 Tax=Microbacterium halophytorum TaxID=2067568 RepID=UPI001319D6AB|nr:GAF domain-containing protein [Microbacterium halophytorum]